MNRAGQATFVLTSRTGDLLLELDASSQDERDSWVSPALAAMEEMGKRGVRGEPLLGSPISRVNTSDAERGTGHYTALLAREQRCFGTACGPLIDVAAVGDLALVLPQDLTFTRPTH